MNNNEIIVCGSAAAEGIPAYFCECRVCREANALGGREIRGRTSYNFGGVLQIDFGPDTLQAMQVNYPRMNEMCHVLISHSHADHFSPHELVYHEKCFSHLADGKKLTLYGSKPTKKVLFDNLPENENNWYRPSRLGVLFNEVTAFEPFEIPEIGAKVIPLKADHDTKLDPFIYIVSFRGRTVLFGNDTGYFPEETWKYLDTLKNIKLDVAILDNTGAFLSWRDGHMGSAAVLDVFAKLEKRGMINADTVKVVNHFSHNGGATHKELCEFYEPKGILVGYDGMKI